MITMTSLLPSCSHKMSCCGLFRWHEKKNKVNEGKKLMKNRKTKIITKNIDLQLINFHLPLTTVLLCFV